MIEFCVKFADVPIRVRAEDDRLQSFCRDYLTADRPAFCVDASGFGSEAYLDLHTKVSTGLIDFGAFLFHASAIAYRGEAVLFGALSGTGKSTHSAYWKRAFGDDVVYVNDDKPFIRVGQNTVAQPRVYGSPWNGKHHLGSNISAPIKALCIIERGDEPGIEEISGNELLTEIFVQSYRPDDSEKMGATLSLLDELLHKVRMYRLTCTMSEESAQLARDTIFGSN